MYTHIHSLRDLEMHAAAESELAEKSATLAHEIYVSYVSASYAQLVPVSIQHISKIVNPKYIREP